MKTGHRAIQLHTYGPQPSMCVNLYVCMPSSSVPGVCLPSGCICVCFCPPSVWARAKGVHCRECVAGHGGYISCWVIHQLPLHLPTVCPPIHSVAHVPRPIKVNDLKVKDTVLVKSLRWRMTFRFIQKRVTHLLYYMVVMIPTTNSHPKSHCFSHKFVHALLKAR